MKTTWDNKALKHIQLAIKACLGRSKGEWVSMLLPENEEQRKLRDYYIQQLSNLHTKLVKKNLELVKKELKKAKVAEDEI